MKYSVYSDSGTVKQENQDAFLLRVARNQTHRMGMAAICDGVSSADDGRYASHFVIQRLEEVFERMKKEHVPLASEIMHIHNALQEEGKRRHQTLGTTLSLFCFLDDDIRIIQIGDSRIYLYHDELKQISADQTLARWKYDNQTISLEEYQVSNEHHILTQCLGITRGLHVKEEHFQWQEEDGVLLCSDGLYHLTPAQDLQEHMRMFLTDRLEKPAKALAQIAMEQGEEDNVSVLLFSRGHAS